jgi:hypothetical protein
MPPSPLGRGDAITTKLPAPTLRAYLPSNEPQIVELALRYLRPGARARARACVQTFVDLTNAGFFAPTAVAAFRSAAELLHEAEGPPDGGADGGNLGAWSLQLTATALVGLQWLRGALLEAEVPLDWCSVPLDDAPAGGSHIQAALAGWNFRVISRRSSSGFYVRLSFLRPVDDVDERAFRALLAQWGDLVRGLPSRDHHAGARLTTKPSFERGASVLAAAGRQIDAVSGPPESCLLNALGRFHHTVAPLAEVLVELP